MRVKKNIGYWNFFTNKNKKDHSTIYQEIKLAERELRFNSSDQCLSKLQHFTGYLWGHLLASPQNTVNLTCNQ